MSITFKGHTISSIAVDTFMGHSGDRIFDIPPFITNLWPAYRELRRIIKDRGVTVFTKSSTYRPNQGNFHFRNILTWKYIRRLGSNGACSTLTG